MTLLLAVALLVVVADAASKWAATTVLAEGRLYGAWAGWGLRRVTNPRQRLSSMQAAVLLAIILGAVAAAAPRGSTALGLGLAIGGAAGNVVERIRRGAVVDFVAAGPWPVFNLADAAMTIGLLLTAVRVL